MLVKLVHHDLFVLIEHGVAWSSDDAEPFPVDLLPDDDDPDAEKKERAILMAIKEKWGEKHFPQTITKNLRQAHAVWRVKARLTSPEQGFNALMWLLNP